MPVSDPTSQLVFGCRVLRQLLRGPGQNIVLSPASLKLAIGMAAAGAQGKTRDALENALGEDAEAAALGAEQFLRSVQGLPPGVSLELASSLWTRSGLPLADEYRQAMQARYRAEVRQLDFASREATGLINSWVAGATHGAIDGILDSIEPDSLLLLISAAYFHGLWMTPFSRKKTVDHRFVLGSGEVTSVPLMHMGGTFYYGEDDHVQAVQLLYQHYRFSLVVVVPRQPLPLAAFEDIAEPGSLTRILRSLRDRKGSLALPRVGVGFQVNLQDPLREMGMGVAFGPGADFSQIFGSAVPARISRVVHRTMLEINEEGTRGASTTAMNVTLSASLAPPPAPFEMIVDRPFLALISDSETHEILFLGVIGDPAPARNN